MEITSSSTVFISYSRRQLYFAESLALHLQKEKLNVWFDLQQLQAGTVWSDGLKNGISEAKTLVLIVSKASLASSYVADEWKGVATKGNQLVLVIYESVELPEELLGLPTYDFRTGFNKKLRDLTAYIKGEADPRHDNVSVANRLKGAIKMPAAVWLTLLAQFGAWITCILGFVLIDSTHSGSDKPLFLASLLTLTALSFALGLWYGIPFLRHKQTYQQVKRSILLSFLVLIPIFFSFGSNIETSLDLRTWLDYLFWFGYLAIVGFHVFVYLIPIRYSIDFLRWMQPEENLQKLRRRVHQRLISKETFDVDIDIESKKISKAISYMIHSDPADRPLTKWITKHFSKVGHSQVTLAENPEHHIAILSNRSSAAWVQEVTRSYAGKLVFVVVSTIEFTESLKEVGRYQWIDARDMDTHDIIGLAKSLEDETDGKRKAALEATPDKINRWKMPSGIKLLRGVLGVLGVYALILSFMHIIPSPTGEKAPIGDIRESILFLFVGASSFWLVAKGLVQRKLPALIVYGCTLLNIILLSFFGNPFVFNDGPEYQRWLLLALTIPLLVISVIEGRHWLPTFARVNHDEVGINKTIVRTYWKKRILVVAAWVVFFIGIAIWLKLSAPKAFL
ncbi:toll/interleukin-1 receptor domain-containing protein [bacterium]|nr:toll/interleukin-1 receptor domain-containing protein [bacterium]